MLKAKQKTVSILVAFLTLLAALILGVTSLFSAPQVTASAATQTYAETSFGEGKFLITTTFDGNTYYLPATTTSSGPAAKVFTDVNTIDDSNLWTVTASGSNYYIQNASGSYLYTTSANNGVRVGSTEGTWTYGSDNSLKYTTTSRFLGIYNAADWRSYNTVDASNYKGSSTALKFYKVKDLSADCAHANVSTVYDSAKGEHYGYCEDCKTELEDTRETCSFGDATPNSIGGGKHTLTQVCDVCEGKKVTTVDCSNFTEGDWKTEDGVHTRTLTCTDCGGEQEESGDCQISEGEWVREGDEHSKTGTCTVCGDSTTVTEACTLNYTNVSNDDKTHTTTSTCSVCGQDSEPEIMDCTFGESWEAGDVELTYTCQYCEYSYTEAATLYTVTYSVPEGVEAPAAAVVADGYSTVLSEADDYDKYTFVGWTNESYPQNTQAPEVIYEVGDKYEVTADVILYALYTYSEGTAEESWELVTDANEQLAVGKEIVIVASSSDYALGTTQNGNNRAAVSITKEDGTVTVGDTVQVITLEAGTVDGTWAFYVAGGTGTNAVNGGYLYAAGGTGKNNYLRTQVDLTVTSSWNITISNNIATIKTADSSVARHTIMYNSSNTIFSCYASGQASVSIYMKTGGATVLYTTSFGEHEHVGTNVEITEPTCTEAGVERTVCECGYIVGEVELPALGHNYVDNICSVCGEQDPASIDYSGYYYISFTHSETVYYVDNSQQSSGRYYAKTEAPSVETVNTKYVYRLEKTATGIYSLYPFDGDVYQEDITVEKVGDVYRFYATVGGDACQFLLNAGSETKYIKFYKASIAGQSNYAQDITLTPVELSADIDEATLTLSDDVAVNYYVDMSDEFAEAIMQFKVGEAEEVIEVKATAVGDRYMFTINLAPQLMIENISAVLVYNNVELDKIENYSIQQYAINQLNNAGSSTELKRLVSNMLHYGAAAQLYRGYKTTELANDSNVVENILAASSNEPTETDRKIVNNSEIQQYPAYFTSVNVWFDAVNKIIIKVNTTENVTLSIKVGEDVAITSTTIYTDGILATEFDTTYTFVLKCNGVVMQTLTYSVNAYVYAALAEGSGATDEMKALALALYNYGASAEAYGA